MGGGSKKYCSLHHICTARLAFLPHTDKTSHRGPARQAAPAPQSRASPLKPIISPRVPSSRRRRARTVPSCSRCSYCLTTSSTRPSPNPVTNRDRDPTTRTARESPPAARSLTTAPDPAQNQPTRSPPPHRSPLPAASNLSVIIWSEWPPPASSIGPQQTHLRASSLRPTPFQQDRSQRPSPPSPPSATI